MRIFSVIVIFSIYMENVILINYNKDNFQINKIIDFIIYTLKPHQIAIFTSNLTSANNFHTDISSEIPTFIIDLTTTSSNTFRRLTKFTWELNIIICKDNNHKRSLRNVYEILHFIVEKSPIHARPKCLIILLNSNSLVSSDYRQILKSAWNLKFLDFSVLRVTYKGKITFMNYDPMKKTFNTGLLKSHTQIFPDKLSNMNNYTIKMPFVDFDTFAVLNDGKVNDKIKSKHNVFPTLLVLSEKMNFHINYYTDLTHLLHKNILSMIDTATKALENNEANMLPFAMIIGMSLTNKEVVIGRVVNSTAFLIVVPIRSKKRLILSSKLYVYIVVLPIIVLCYIFASRGLKFERKYWGFLEIFGIIFSMPVLTPRTWPERIVFLSMTWLSIYWSIEFFSTFTDIKFVGDEESFNSFESIVKSKLTLYTDLRPHEHDSGIVKKLLLESITNLDPINCIRKLTRLKKSS